jgi:hypothetical protein
MELLQKLNYKNHKSVAIIDAPLDLAHVIESFGDTLPVKSSIDAGVLADFVVIFVQTKEDVQKHVGEVLPQVKPDVLLWFAYPKKSSKKYRSTIDRDHGWEALGALGYEPVRQIALDEDWSALRFRPVHLIGRSDSCQARD